MHTGRTTRTSKKAGIGEALMSFSAKCQVDNPNPTAGPSGTHQSVSPQPTDFLFPPSDEPADEPVEEPADEPNSSEEEDEPQEPNLPPEVPEPQDAGNKALTQVLELLANNIAGMSTNSKPKSKVKPRVPDTFDGADPSKLESFIFQCNMYLATRSADFPDDEARVTFAMSYLKGSPQDWFQSEISHVASEGGILPEWFSSYSHFLAELKRLFGPRDPITDAMNSLENLRFKDTGKANRYTIDFNRHARKTGWNEQALLRQFYKGLPDRLKDEIARIGKPSGLKALQDMVSTLDQRYWERQSEINKDKKSNNSASANTSANKPTSSDKTSGSQQSNGSKQDNRQQPKKDQKKQANPPTTPANPGKSAIANLLGPDGKLKPEERQRRMDNKLCLRCGKGGHMVNECPTSSKSNTKGRTATVAATPASGTASGSGKA
jgi:hypothetical protein